MRSNACRSYGIAVYDSVSVPIEFEWDDAKAESNRAKHRINFAVAATVFLDRDHVVVDTARAEDGEPRQKVIGAIDGRLFTVVFVMREDVCRIISARRANAKEEAIYG